MSPSDLTTALIQLSKAAEDRRIARRTLKEATETVALAIMKHLRSGDEITLSERGRILEIDRPIEIQMSPKYRVAKILDHSGRPLGQVFLQDHAVLAAMDLKDKPLEVESNALLDYAVVFKGRAKLHPPTLHQHIAFAKEAGEVIDAFRELLEKQGREYGAAARSVTKVVPR